MKVFVASISTETNTFAPAPTGLDAFDVDRSPSVEAMPETDTWRSTLLKLSEDGAHEVALGPSAFAQPSGSTLREAYESLRDELLDCLKRAMPVDAVVLPLHGAMVADGYPDCEGDIIERVRGIVGPHIPIGVELDLHCHFTERMRTHSDVIVAYKEYPHTDVLERFVETWHLTLDTARKQINPCMSVVDCRMVSFWHTTREPMVGFVTKMAELESREGVLSVSFGQGFPYGDVPEAGAKIWVVTDDDEELGMRLAEELRRDLWSIRFETGADEIELAEALSRLERWSESKPLVMADIADNAGGGASSDSTFILQGLLDHQIGNVALGPFWDLGAIAMCREAGEGSRLRLRVGGKCSPHSGAPVDLQVTVRAIREDHVQEIPGVYSSRCGPSVWVSTDDGIDLVLISRRQQAYAQNLFTGLGVNLAEKRGIVVKSSQHFYADLAPLAGDVAYVNTPGLLRTDFENIAYELRDINFWPRVEDPFTGARS